MTIDIHALLEKNPITKAMLKPKFGYRYLRPYNDLENQLIHDKNTGDILKYYDKPKSVLDKIVSRHDTCYSVGKNKTIVIKLWLMKLTIFFIKNAHTVHMQLNR